MFCRVAGSAACILLLAGCQQASPGLNGPAGVAGPSSVAMKAVDVPFSGAVTGLLHFEASNPQGCVGAIPATGTSDATGTALHMGSVIYHTEQCLTPGPSGTAVDGRKLVLTAANGDEVHGTFVGVARPTGNPGESRVTATFTFDGGTGRFADATGTAEMVGVLNQLTASTFDGRWEWAGTIRY